MTQYNSNYSVIIPIYNGLKFFERCVKDHLKQSYLPKIIIIVDDASSLDQKVTLSHIEKIIKNRVEYKLITHEKNLGASNSIFTGLKKVKTKYFKISAVDDFLEKDCAKKSLKILEKNPQAGFVFSMPSMYFFKQKQIKKYKLRISIRPIYFSPKEFKKLVSKKIFKIYSNTIFFDTDKFNSKNLFDKKFGYMSDLLNSYYMGFTYGACFVPEHLAHYGIHEKQISQNVKNKSQENLNAIILLKKEENIFYKSYISSSLAYDISPLDLIKLLFTKNREIFTFKVFYRSIIFSLWTKIKFIVPSYLVSFILRYF